MKKHKVGITFLGTLFVETALGPPEHEKNCVDVSHPGHSRMHYMTCISHQMQKRKFGITFPGVLFIETAAGYLITKNIVSRFHVPEALECTT
jgi:hypothetical protein